MSTVTHNYIQERCGISAVANAIARMGLIWRETTTGDVGIDGHIEYVDSEGRATGRLVGVQVKSGPSYLIDRGTHWGFMPQEKHRFYWERYPLPVLLVLHDPSSNRTYWADVRQQLQTPSATPNAELRIPKNQVLENCAPESLFAAFGVSGARFLSVPDVLTEFITRRSKNGSFPLSYFELFVHGLTNICRSLYFAMDLACALAEDALAVQHAPTGLGVGPGEHEFLFGYVHFIAEQHIADVQFGDCVIDWYDREMLPRFLAPLTSRGRELVHMIGQQEDGMRAAGTSLPEGRVAQEGLVQMIYTPSHVQRVPVVREFERQILQRLKGSTG